MQATELINHFNNIAEFAQYNDVNAFDYLENVQTTKENHINMQE